MRDDDELYALCDVLGELNSGIIETILGRNKMEHFDNYYDLASRTQRPIIWQSVHHRWAEPTLWQEQLDAVSRIFRDGYRALRAHPDGPPGAALQPAERPALR